MACSGSQESLVERVPGRPSWGRALTTPGRMLCAPKQWPLASDQWLRVWGSPWYLGW